jgi:hypothetical protein
LVDIGFQWAAIFAAASERSFWSLKASYDMGLLAQFCEVQAMIFMTLETVGGRLDRQA